jgi:hypothetical protein
VSQVASKVRLAIPAAVLAALFGTGAAFAGGTQVMATSLWSKSCRLLGSGIEEARH